MTLNPDLCSVLDGQGRQCPYHRTIGDRCKFHHQQSGPGVQDEFVPSKDATPQQHEVLGETV